MILLSGVLLLFTLLLLLYNPIYCFVVLCDHFRFERICLRERRKFYTYRYFYLEYIVVKNYIFTFLLYLLASEKVYHHHSCFEFRFNRMNINLPHLFS